ncbi:MAG: hypothetical protein ACRD29_23995 [Acidimicrobiales bacterium]
MTAADVAADVAAVREFRRAVRRRRLANVHWVDALYRVYVTALFGIVAVLLVSDRVGDDPVRGAALDTVRERGPAWTGLIVAVAVAVGLRSGSRGGPLALERADIRHVLLAPVDRASALRAPAIRQVRFALFVGTVVGAVGGDLASARLPREEAAWVAAGAAFGLTTAALGYGAAFAASGLRLPRWAATALALVLVGLAVADTAEVIAYSPTRLVGDVALWPIGFDPAELLAVPLAAGLLLFGFARLGTLSLEAAERRSTLVGQLRFAATLQDVRTVIILRRQLALELPRVRPWVRLRARGFDRFPVWSRGWRGVLRWPLSRLVRLGLAAAVAALAMRGVWDGTTPLIVVAGLALYIAGLEAVEPLAQEIDHPSRRDAVPHRSGEIHLRHVPVVVAVLVPVGVLAAAIAVAFGPSAGAVGLAGVVLVPAVLGAAASGIVSTVKGAPDPFENQMLLPPEAAGPRLAFRTVLPPALAVGGLLPVLFARFAADGGDPAAAAAATPAMFVVVVFSWVCAWVRVRDDLRRRLHEQMSAQAAIRSGQSEAGGG